MRSLRFILCIFILSWIGISSASAWGFVGHRLINQKAIDALPPGPLLEFFKKYETFVIKNAPLPDQRRQFDPMEAPYHFVDIEYFGGLDYTDSPHASPPAFAGRLWGQVPWRIAEVYDSLVVSMRESNPAETLRWATALGHYVADAHVPLHTTANYNGQMTGQRGVHSRWESRLVERMEPELQSLEAETFQLTEDVSDEAWRYVREAHAHLPELLAHDSAALMADPGAGDTFYALFRATEAERVRERMRSSAGDLAALWGKAWRDADSPSFDGLPEVVDVSISKEIFRVRGTDVSWTFLVENFGTAQPGAVMIRLSFSGDPADSAVQEFEISELPARFSGHGTLKSAGKKFTLEVHAKVSGDIEPGNNRLRLREPWR